MNAQQHSKRKHHFGPNLGHKILFREVAALPDVRHCPKPQSFAILGKTDDANLRKWQKP